MSIKNSLLFIIALLHFSVIGFSNNLTISNGYKVDNTIYADLSWDNSWNLTAQGGNFDAVWVFIKGKNSSGNWIHIDVSSSSSFHSTQYPLSINAVDDGKGIFVINSSNGIQNISPTQISIYSTTDLSSFSEIRIFGIEMVYIPEDQYFLGDGASISSLSNSHGNPFLITSEDLISTENLIIKNPNSQFSPQVLPSIIPAEFPKGFASFYIMKYEISQLQYVDFLNTLTYSQQQKRTTSPPSSSEGTFVMINPVQPDSLYRNGIAILAPGIASSKPATYALNANANGSFNDDSDGLFRAANFLNWGDISAYLDWAALRPITELEFEKACRGLINSVEGEFAWGTNLITNANTPTLDGTIFEGVSNVATPGSGIANHGNFVASQGWGLRGVLRTGFAANNNTSRLEAGASYYGVMELSGNVWEHTIMIAGGGEAFVGNPGDGILNENGDANQTSWCNPSSAEGVILRGGGWGSTIAAVGSWRDLAISDRFYSHLKPSSRRNSTGGRGGR
jgi:formylglycine-generating enzyme required for sulfatase activity